MTEPSSRASAASRGICTLILRVSAPARTVRFVGLSARVEHVGLARRGRPLYYWLPSLLQSNAIARPRGAVRLMSTSTASASPATVGALAPIDSDERLHSLD